MALKKGEAMLEFFSLLKILKKLYEDDGYRSAKMLYEKVKNDHKIKMSYEQFNIYFKRNLAPQKEVKISGGPTPKNEAETVGSSNGDHTIVQTIEETREEETGPIVLRDRQKKTSFSPYAVKIDDPKKIW
ncbi:MAG: hypothetical protein JZU62_04395 [Sulfuricurvum sp.]|uniref:hypothetical protein n=1 Tax=Sulfuricurvum sp. TaxID=2025608 RepID=UPI0025F3D753|nr:hypothetical protein [Sulfuricurvum sp.]MBV5320904.1 hypothetical protein [Sulfuricurvum sp.]